MLRCGGGADAAQLRKSALLDRPFAQQALNQHAAPRVVEQVGTTLLPGRQQALFAREFAVERCAQLAELGQKCVAQLVAFNLARAASRSLTEIAR